MTARVDRQQSGSDPSCPPKFRNQNIGVALIAPCRHYQCLSKYELRNLFLHAHGVFSQNRGVPELTLRIHPQSSPPEFSAEVHRRSSTPEFTAGVPSPELAADRQIASVLGPSCSPGTRSTHATLLSKRSGTTPVRLLEHVPNLGRSWPKQGQHRSKSVNFGPNSRNFGTMSANIGPASASFGAMPTDVGPKSANLGQFGIDRTWPEFGRTRPIFANIDQQWPRSERSQPQFAPDRSNSTNLGHGSTKFGSKSTTCGKLCPEWTNLCPASTKSGTIVGRQRRQRTQGALKARVQLRSDLGRRPLAAFSGVARARAARTKTTTKSGPSSAKLCPMSTNKLTMSEKWPSLARVRLLVARSRPIGPASATNAGPEKTNNAVRSSAKLGTTSVKFGPPAGPKTGDRGSDSDDVPFSSGCGCGHGAEFGDPAECIWTSEIGSAAKVNARKRGMLSEFES